MFKRILLLLLMLVTVTGVAVADGMYVFCQPDSIVNVRSKPSGRAQAWLNCGDLVEVDGKIKKVGKSMWVHVIDIPAEVSHGWVYGDFLSEYPINVDTRNARSCSNTRLAIRKSPNGKVKKWLKNGEDITIFADNGEWAITKYGYVKMEYLEFVEVVEDE